MVHNEFRLDNKTISDYKQQIEKLAESYVPEWKFDEKNPDIGSVIALIYAKQLYDNSCRYNGMLEKYHREMVNLLDISLQQAHPAGATVIMDVVPDTVNGVPVRKGTKLLADDEDKKIVFETAQSVYMSGASIETIMMSRGYDGKLIPLYGSFVQKDYAGNICDDEEAADSDIKPFKLFDFSKAGIGKQALLLYHDSIFDVEDELLDCRITGNAQFLKALENKEYRMLYYTDEGFLPVEQYNIHGEHIYFTKSLKSKKVSVKDKEYSLIVIEACKPQTETVEFKGIEFASSGSPVNAEYIGNGTTDFDVNRFNIFGDILSLYSECYIGMDSYFAKKDSKITLSFDMSFGEKYVGAVREPEKADLRVIKRKKRFEIEERIAYCHAENISIEYFNGVGWKRLKCDKEYENIFKEDEEGRIEISFICPSDWKASSSGGYQGRMLKVQLLKADNCYYQPCMHCYPRITDLNISYTYNENYKKPVFATRLYGTKSQDLTVNILENKTFTAFSKGNYADTAIYLGFDKVFDNGPISIWWKLHNSARDMDKKLRFFYSTNSEFKEMKVVDYTEGLSKTGIMMFLPEPDIGMLELEGKKQCWIKITEENYQEEQLCTEIEKIAINAVMAYNAETLDEEEFYLETVNPNESFPLRADKILTADVWVNEKNDLTKQEMNRLMQTDPDSIRVSYDYMGEIEEFFVKWQECSNFLNSKPDSRHYVLDRMQNKIIFGDGVHVRIPRNTQGTAFIVRVKCCEGKAGNVAANTITSSLSNMMFINNIYNPEPAFGGSDMEMLEKAMERGANLFSSGGRLVTEQDYLNEITNYSDIIESASIVRNVDRYGNYNQGMIYVVMLMKDFMDSSASFYRIQGNLKQHILKKCELSILPEQLVIEEPLFVELCVDIWAEAIHIEDNFEIQNRVQESLKEYFNPISQAHTKGWKIGTLPRKSQIVMRLNAVKSKAIVKHVMVTARYADKDGVHETDLENIKVSPFMVVKNGTHKIHLSHKTTN